MTLSRHAVAKSCLLLLISCVLALSSMIALPSMASADTGSTSGTLSTADPVYVPNVNPCGAGSSPAHYEVIQVRLVGTSASTLTATVNPNGFRGTLGVYQGVFLPNAPGTNCFGTVTGGSSGSAVTYTTPLGPLLPGYTEQTFYFVVGGVTTADQGTFTVSITSTNADVIIVPPTPVADTTKPVLTLLNSYVGEATGPSGRVVTYSATANDNVDGALTPTCSPASGSTFAITTTTVNCSATDAAGNVGTGSMTVKVQDTAGPVLTLPGGPTVAATGASGAVVTYSATANDLVDGSRAVTCSPASGSTFSIGTTTVNCTSTDTRSNTKTGSFAVKVVDSTKPVVTVPSNITGEATGPSGRTVSYSASATDDIDGALATTCSPASGTFAIATTTVNCSATDAAGNTGTGSFTVKVQDTTGPVLTLPGGPTVAATGASGAVVTYAATASDVVDGSRPVTCSPASGSTFSIGTTTVNCTSTDTRSNTKTGSFAVKVVDSTKPVLTVPNNISAEATGPSGRTVNYTATATDNVDGALTLTCSPASGSTFAITTTTVNCTATDAAGNTGTDLFTVKVQDTTGPVLSLPSTLTRSATGASGVVVTYSATASDVVDGSRPVTCSPASGSTFPIDTTTVNCSSTDTRNNTTNGSFSVVVSEGTLTTSGSVTITGTPKVGKELTATSTVTTTPVAASTTGQWMRDGAPISSATASTYTLTGADLGKDITYRQRDALPGYVTATATSNVLGPVALGEISLPTPTIGGTAQVGKTLTAELGTVAPADVGVAFEWFAGVDSLGTASTYVVKAADLGKAITLKVTGTKEFYETATADSVATDDVIAGEFISTGVVTVDGTAKVGQTLTASSTVTTSPAATSITGQWFRGDSPIADATAPTYVLTNDDVSSEISYRETRTRSGYVTLPSSSAPTVTITGGIITLGTPTISGNAIVDQVLTATPGAVDPASAAVALTWNVDGVSTGVTGTTYTVRPGDVGKPVTVTAQATKPDYDIVRKTSVPSADVEKATFSTGVSAAISGVFKVGEELTANEGTVVPTPDSYTYQWFAGDDPIDGATSRTFTLEKAQKNASIKVVVAAVRDGYVTSSGTSDASAKVVTNVAPDLTLSPAASKLRLGQATTLSWTSGDAISLEASGSWAGAKSESGTETVTPAATGTQTYTLKATNGSGTTTAQVAVEVALPVAKLTVKARKTVKAGRKITVSTKGLAPREAYSVRLGGKLIASGKATASGKVKRAVRVPASTKAGKRLVRVTGSLADRTGTTRVTVTKTKALTVSLRDSSVRASDDQRVTVSNLRPREKVTVTYKGERISPKSARANAKGVYTLTFDVDIHWGRKTVEVTASGRSTAAQFTVVNRCPQGGYYCR